MSNRVLIADNVSEGCDQVLRDRGIEVVRAVGLEEDHLNEMVADFDGMIVRSAVKVRRPMIERMERMRVIGRAGVGVDNIDVEAAKEKGIVVMNTPDGNTISAAEHTVGMILATCRNIPNANHSLRDNQWNRKQFVGTELYGKTVGILGVGRIGREVAKRLRGFDLTLLGYDPMLSSQAILDAGLAPATFEEVLSRSDIVSLHLPINEETGGMIGEDQLGQMKEGSILINCARGGIVDEDAVVAALESGRLAGAGFDVFENEPPNFPNSLINHPKVVSTPHIAASTSEAQIRVAIAIGRQVGAFLFGEEPVGVLQP